MVSKVKFIPDRETDQPFFRVLTKNGQLIIDKKLMCRMVGTKKAVRVTKSEYPEEAVEGTLLYHFGLPLNADFVGTMVSLARIIEHGYFLKDGQEKIPLLSFDNIWQATIQERIASTTYDKLLEKYFRNSIGRANNIDSVKGLILTRYRNSLPDLTDEEILDRGVSVRLLKLVKKVSFPNLG